MQLFSSLGLAIFLANMEYDLRVRSVMDQMRAVFGEDTARVFPRLDVDIREAIREDLPWGS